MLQKYYTFDFLTVHKTIIFIIIFALNMSCKNDQSLQSTPKQPCEKDAVLLLSRLTTKVYPPPSGLNSDSTTCPQFIYWERPFHIGDSLVVEVSQDLGDQIIGSKPVCVTITSKLGDTETYGT